MAASDDRVSLVQYVQAHSGVLPQELAEHFSISTRTLRSRVNSLNAEICDFACVNLQRGAGYSLAVFDEARLAAWIESAASQVHVGVPTGSRERVAYLLEDLLQRGSWVTLDDLSRILYVSRPALSGDLKLVEQTLNKFDLSLERRPHHGLRVSGSELNRRLCLVNCLVEKVSGAKSAGAEQPADRFLSGLLGTDSNRELVDAVTTAVERAADSGGYQISSVAYQNLLVHLAVAIERIKDGCYVPMAEENLSAIRSQREYAIAGIVATELEKSLGVELPESEIAYIAIHLAGKQSLYDVDETPGPGSLIISDEVWDVVSEMLESVWQALRFDFREDLELRMNLARHIVPLTVRMKYHMNMRNPLLHDIKERYSLAYSMGLEASAVLARHYDSILSDDEMGYIALAFALAIERQKSDAPKKNILVVCASGAGSARLLEYRCRQEFGPYINDVIACDVLNVGEIDFSSIDYVFTTVPIALELPVPVREVKYFFRDPQEVKTMRDDLMSAVPRRAGLEFIDPDLFFAHLSFSGKEEALNFLIDRSMERHDVMDDYRELVWEREALMPTSIGNRVAMPHPQRIASKDSFVCVGLLDAPVVWDDFGHEVEAIFLMSFSEDAGRVQHDFLELFARFMMSKDDVDAFLTLRTPEVLGELLLQHVESPHTQN